MKKIILGLMVLSFQLATAQKIAYIEMDAILEKMPEFNKANEEIDAAVEQWENELNAKFDAVEQMYQEYVQNESMFSDEEKMAKQDDIFQAENEAKEFREQKFGREGEVYEMQESKIKPLTDKVYDAAEEVAKNNGYDYIFDKSGETNWIYTNPEHNLTEQVISNLGLKD